MGALQEAGFCEVQDIGPPEIEYSRAISCDTTNSGALRGGGEATGDTSPTEVVGEVRNRLDVGKGEGVRGSGASGSKRGSVGDTAIGIGSGIVPSPPTGVDRWRHKGRGISGSQWFQCGGVERGG